MKESRNVVLECKFTLSVKTDDIDCYKEITRVNSGWSHRVEQDGRVMYAMNIVLDGQYPARMMRHLLLDLGPTTRSNIRYMVIENAIWKAISHLHEIKYTNAFIVEARDEFGAVATVSCIKL